MARHVDFLGVLYLIWGGLTGLLGLSMLALAAGAAMIVVSAAPADEGTRAAAGVTAATFGLVAFVALVWGGANMFSGRALRRRRQWSRGATLTLGIVNLLVLPFGTALGVYTLWVLLHEEAKNISDL